MRFMFCVALPFLGGLFGIFLYCICVLPIVAVLNIPFIAAMFFNGRYYTIR